MLKSFSPNGKVALKQKQCQFYYQEGSLNPLPNTYSVKTNNGAQSERNFPKIDLLLNKSFTQNFRERY